MTQADPGPSGRGTIQAVLQAPFLSALRRLLSSRQQQLNKDFYKAANTVARDEFSALQQQMGTTAEVTSDPAKHGTVYRGRTASQTTEI